MRSAIHAIWSKNGQTGQQMASIQKRGNSYRARIIRKGLPTYSKTFSNKNDALRWARQTEASIDKGDLKPEPILPSGFKQSELTFGIAAQYFMEVKTILKRNHKSESGIIKILVKRWGSLNIDQIDKFKVIELRDELLRKGRANDTVNHYFNAISKIWQFLTEEWGCISINPIKQVKRLPQNKGRIRRLFPRDEDKLIQACKEINGRDISDFLKFAIQTAMRRSEILGLTWQDISLENRTAFLKHTKNGSSRAVPLSLEAVKILKSIKPVTERIFNISEATLKRQFNTAITRASNSLPPNSQNPFHGLRVHDLRHEALSRLSDHGLNVIELSIISGHKTISMLNRYTHPSHQAIFSKMDK